MVTRKLYADLANCNSCQQCGHYPYFHYVPVKELDTKLITNEFDIEYIKFDKNHSEVINHTTGVKHVYDGFNHKWIKQN